MSVFYIKSCSLIFFNSLRPSSYEIIRTTLLLYSALHNSEIILTDNEVIFTRALNSLQELFKFIGWTARKGREKVCPKMGCAP
jgi:hypothetical protein